MSFNAKDVSISRSHDFMTGSTNVVVSIKCALGALITEEVLDDAGTGEARETVIRDAEDLAVKLLLGAPEQHLRRFGEAVELISLPELRRLASEK